MPFTMKLMGTLLAGRDLLEAGGLQYSWQMFSVGEGAQQENVSANKGR